MAFVTFTEPSGIKAAIDAFHDYSIGPHRLSIAPAQREQQPQPGGRQAGGSSGTASSGEDGGVRGGSGAAQQLSHGTAAGAAELAPAHLMYAAQYGGGAVPLRLAQPYMAAAAAVQQQQFLAAAQLGGQPAAAAAALYSGTPAAPASALYPLGGGGLALPSVYGSPAAAGGLVSAVSEEHSRDTLYVRPLPESLDEAGLRDIFQAGASWAQPRWVQRAGPGAAGCSCAGLGAAGRAPQAPPGPAHLPASPHRRNNNWPSRASEAELTRASCRPPQPPECSITARLRPPRF